MRIRPRALGVALGLWLVLASGARSATAAQAVPDSVLVARVEAALAAASDLPADSIRVEVEDGVVVLTGSLVCDECGGMRTPGGTATIQQSVGAIVRAVPGVDRVRFYLTYRRPSSG